MVTSQDMGGMPLVFGWYPPPNVTPDMTTASIYYQTSMLPPLMSPPHSIENPLEVARSETMETLYSSDDDDNESDEEGDDVMESETDNFFDCEMETNEMTQVQNEEATGSSSSSIQPSVQLVSKRNLQTFETDTNKDIAPQAQARRRRDTKSNERDKESKRNSMSSVQSKSGLASASDSKSKVVKSLSNNDIKVVKPTSIWSTSPLRRVLSPFSSSPPKAPPSTSASNLKRSGSTSSRASLNLEKKRKSESAKLEKT